MNPNNQNQNPANKSNKGFLSGLFTPPTINQNDPISAMTQGFFNSRNSIVPKIQQPQRPQQSMVPTQQTQVQKPTRPTQQNMNTSQTWDTTGGSRMNTSSNGSLAQTYNQQNAGNLAQTYNAQSPSYYAQQYEDTAKGAQGLVNQYAPKVSAPYSEFGIGDTQKKLSDYELTRMNTLLKGYDYPMQAYGNLMTASQPKTIGPTDYAYNPLEGAQGANQGGGSIAQRVGQAAAINQIPGQMQQLTGLQQQSQNLNQIGNMLMQKIPGANSPINAINALSQNVLKNFSSQDLAQFQANLNTLAGMFPDQAKNIVGLDYGNLSSKNVRAIKAFLTAVQAGNTAQTGTTQSTLNNLSNVANRTQSPTNINQGFSGFTGGGAF